MKNFILVILLAVAALTSCKRVDAEEEGKTYETVEIEGCEYIQVSEDEGYNTAIYSLTHKGNCANHNSNLETN